MRPRPLAPPGDATPNDTPSRRLLSITSPGTGLNWIVTSRPTSDDQAMADFCTSTTPPSVTPERKVMMAISSIRVRPATDRSGTIGVVRDRPRKRGASVMEIELSIAQQHSGKIEAVEQRQ